MAVAVAPSTARWRIRTADLVAWSSRMLSSNSDPPVVIRAARWVVHRKYMSSTTSSPKLAGVVGT